MKLSIITINFNNAAGLKQTLDSVACQTWRDFEHIIIDGGSIDESVEVINDYTLLMENKYTRNHPTGINNHQHFPLTIKWVSEKDEGIYNAMNKGFRMASGEYCLFLNSGDQLSSENVLETVFNLANGSDIVYGTLSMCYSNGRKSIYGRTGTDFSLFELLDTPLPHPSSFIKKTLLEECGLYDESYKLAADAKFFIQATVLKNCTVQYVDYVVSDFDAYGASSNKDLVDKERKRIMKDLFPARLYGDYLKRLEYDKNAVSIVKYKEYIEICKIIKRNVFTRKILTFMYKLLK